MRFSKRVGNQFWQLVSLTNDHTCRRTAKNRQAKTEWLAKKFIPILRHTPEMRPKGLIAESFEKWGVKLSSAQAYRAKTRALELIQGAETEQYSKLRNYAEELRRSNPNSTVIIKCGVSDKGPVFERIYVCLEACKAAFAYTCRPLIGLDACFLKGEFGGQLMTAVGQDGNNQIYPIAYDVGLVPAIAELGPNVEHRLCVKHLYGNWKKKYPGGHMKQLLWQAVRATVVPDWERAMQKIKDINEDAWKEIMEIRPSMWTRSAYRTASHCDLQVNNMCEAFNMAILEYRDKPVITLLEGLKHYITVRIVKQKNLMSRFRNTLCPRVEQIIERLKRSAGGWTPTWHGDDAFNLFSVTNGVDTYEVNLERFYCACRKWALSGIPCVHAMVCILHNKVEVEPYVSKYYRKTSFMATYSYIVLPSNGPRLWPTAEGEPINPPVMRRAPGRPKKKRNKANDEPTSSNMLPRSLTIVKCKSCGNFGHNSRTCKGKTAADRQLPKGSNKNKKQNKASTKGGNKTKKQKKASTTEAPTVLTQGSQAPQTQETSC
ncbi:uncharacterized protein LOC131597563 [Vicia villosa]|uniref:uncharacterized protein LOC131597563 n=1 Tax=Vicia villosa TaxID=3911 RepID=UPI00273C6F33|nr:uncharacterized protein LOC131597563 [Vicia villosa]